MKEINKEYFIALVGVVFLISLLLSFGVFDFLTRSNTKDLVIKLEKTETEDENFKVEMKITDVQGHGLSPVYVTVYSQNGKVVYGYTMLRTNENGKLSFPLSKGNYTAFLSTEDRTKHGYFFSKVNINVEGEGKKVLKKELVPVQINLRNFKYLPEMKVEIVQIMKKFPGNYILPIMFARKPKGDEKINFFLSPGKYNINLDQESFTENKSKTFALAKRGLEIDSPQEITFNSDNSRKIKIGMNGTKYGWFKLISSHIGDFQSMYFGEPVSVFTNLRNLEVEMTYIPLQECVKNFKVKSRAMWQECLNTDIRYDFREKIGRSRKEFLITPPKKLKVRLKENEIRQCEKIDVEFNVKNGRGTNFKGFYIHQMFGKAIMPEIFLRNKTSNEVIYQDDFFTENYNHYIPFKSSYEEKLPVHPGEYVLELRLPNPWTDKLLEASKEIEILPSENCSISKKGEIPSYRYNSWQELMENKVEVFKKGEGYDLSFPSTHKEFEKNFGNLIKANSCDDLRNSSRNGSVLIKLNENNAESIQEQNEYSACIKDYIKGHNVTSVILEDTFSGLYASFPTHKWFIYYHFYRIIKEADENVPVGLHSTILCQYFFDYFDFFVSKEGNICEWADSYPHLISQEKIICMNKSRYSNVFYVFPFTLKNLTLRDIYRRKPSVLNTYLGMTTVESENYLTFNFIDNVSKFEKIFADQNITASDFNRRVYIADIKNNQRIYIWRYKDYIVSTNPCGPEELKEKEDEVKKIVNKISPSQDISL